MAGKFGPKNRHCSTRLYLVPYEPCGKISKSRITFSLNLRTCLASLWGFMFSGSKHTGLRHFKTCNLAPNTGFRYQTEEDGGWHGGDRERTRDMAVASRSLLLTAARGKRAVNLLHHLCEVRAGVMRRGQQVLRCCDTDRKSREIEINAHPSTR